MTTIRQKRRAKIIGKNSTTEAELIEAGYSPSTARHQPPSVMKAKGWEGLVEKALPDGELLEVHKAGLHAKKQIGAMILVQGDGTVLNKNDEGMIEVEDHATQHKFLETAYKVKGRFNVNNIGVQINFNEHARGQLDKYTTNE